MFDLLVQSYLLDPILEGLSAVTTVVLGWCISLRCLGLWRCSGGSRGRLGKADNLGLDSGEVGAECSNEILESVDMGLVVGYTHTGGRGGVLESFLHV